MGDTIEVYGKTYTLNQLPTVKKTGDRRLNYELIFEGVQYELLDAQFLLPDNTVGDSFTGTLFAFVQILVSNANRVFPGKWSVGEYPDETEYKTLSFTGENCLSVLQRICEEWGQEFEIEQSSGGNLIHYTVEETVRNWTIAATEFGSLVSSTAYNIYARCQKAGNAGSIILGTEQRRVDYEANYYNFMVGLTDTQNYINNNLQQTLTELQNQVDGAIQYYFGAGTPTMSNYPVNTWERSRLELRRI